jgi:hypothetical protein
MERRARFTLRAQVADLAVGRYHDQLSAFVSWNGFQ